MSASVFMKIQGAIETLLGAVSPIQHPKLLNNEVQPALMNIDLLSREVENISLLLSLLVRVLSNIELGSYSHFSVVLLI